MSAASQREAFPPATKLPAGFEAPLILDAPSRGPVAQWRDAVLTGLLWAGWLYLLVAAIGMLWVPPFVHRLLPVSAPESAWPFLAVLACAAVALGGCLWVLERAMRDRRRFAGGDRRSAPPGVGDGEMGTALGAPTLDLASLRSARSIVLRHGADGRLEAAETR